MSLRIAVTTLAYGHDYIRLLKAALDGKRDYCRQHGYTFLPFFECLDPSRAPSWSKVLMLERILKSAQYDWVFWSDADSVVMNPATRLEDIIATIPSHCDFAAAGDGNGAINAGQFLLRNSAWTLDFLTRVYAQTQFVDHNWWEQQAILHLLETNPTDRAKFFRLAQRAINSYPNELAHDGKHAGYQEGDFIVHFPSMRGTQLEFWVNHFLTKRALAELR